MLALAFLSANIWKYIPNEKNKPIGTKKYKELISSKNISRKECILLPFNALKKGLTNGN